MNRQEQRRLGREKVTLTRAELEQMKIQYMDKGFSTAMSIPIVILKENFGFGSKSRLPQFIDLSLRKYLDLQNDRVSMDEMVEKVLDYTGNRVLYGKKLEAFINGAKAD